MDRALTRREWPLVLIAAIALAAVMTAPLVFHLRSHVADTLGDPLLQAWAVAWDGHALLHQPLHPFDANAFWPASHSVAFTDSLLGYAPAGLVGSGPGAAVLRYNLLYLFAYGLAFAGAWLLARELGLRRIGAAVAAAAFAYAPWRASQAGNLNILSSGGIPIAIALLLRGFRRRSPKYVLAGWAVAAWQVSLGFAIGLQLVYGLLLIVPLVAWLTWLRPLGLSAAVRQRGLLAAAVGGGLAFAAIALLMARPYIEVRHEHPESQRTLAAVAAFSPRPLSFLATPAENVAWGYRTSAARSHLYTPGAFAPTDEKTLFPGLTVAALALVGAFGGSLSRRARVGLGVAVLALAALALGTTLDPLAPYRLLRAAPGWDAIRTPGRLATSLMLALGLLAGAGADRVARSVPARRRLLVLLLPLLVLFEGWSPPQLNQVPSEPAVTARPPVLYLPSNRFVDARYMLWSTDDFHPLVNGWSGFAPTLLTRVREVSAGFPRDRRVVPLLRRLGVRSIVVIKPTGQAQAYPVDR